LAREQAELVLDAPAKVNLHLSVLGRRPDGYHELVTLMQPLELCDRLTLERAEPGLTFTCDRPDLEGPDNLVMRAARAFFQAWGREPAVRLALTKRIPVAAGLGGGSSDAAAALLGLNRMHGAPLEPQRLRELARNLGADVPFFLQPHTAWCRGIGEKVEPVPDFERLFYVLVNPGIVVSTAWVYSQLEITWTSASKSNKINPLLGLSRVSALLLSNDLESVTLRTHPELQGVKDVLMGAGAIGALMSGSGPTVFGVYRDRTSAGLAAEKLAGRGGLWVHSCGGLGDRL
jgi:4-diphosphocytidyl-2-C-methyl-D-erythritol kinase